MEIIGVIAEYNPFSNGHKYHLNEIKKMYPESIIIAVISTSFCQRTISFLNKWEKTRICLEEGIDIVIELPFVFSTQGADIFSKGAMAILNNLKVDKIIFGSESNNIDNLKKIAINQLENKNFDEDLKKYLKMGKNYPTSISLASNSKISTPNDLLAISYIKEIIKNNYPITPISIKRTNDYNSLDVKGDIISATSIRNLLSKNMDIKKYIPENEINCIYKNIDIFPFLKYKILSDKNILISYVDVDEGIENRIIKYIKDANNLSELINLVKSKRYTYNRLKRMFIHILCSFTKEEQEKNKNIEYIRILGFNEKGKTYLNKIKKELNIPLITKYKDIESDILDIEYRVLTIYSLIVNDHSLIEKELQKPIIY